MRRGGGVEEEGVEEENVEEGAAGDVDEEQDGANDEAAELSAVTCGPRHNNQHVCRRRGRGRQGGAGTSS